MKKKRTLSALLLGLTLVIAGCSDGTSTSAAESSVTESSTAGADESADAEGDTSEELTSSDDASSSEHVHSYTGTVTTEPTCTEEGVMTYTCSECGDTYTEVIEALGHDYNLESAYWTWADDGSWAKWNAVCTRDETHIVTEDADVEITASTAATCDDDGSVTYTATVTYNEQEYTDTKTVTVAALGHDYDLANATWEWADDYSSAKMIAKCSRDETHTLELPATSITEISRTAAECEKDGEVVYEASLTYNEKEYTNRTTQVLTATGHDYDIDNAVWTWADDYSWAKWTITCQTEATHTHTEDAVVTPTITTAATCEGTGLASYTATVTYNEQEYTNTVEDVVLEALGHNYGEDGYCSQCSEHKPSENLEYTLSSDGTSYSVGMGDCTDTEIWIPASYNGLPVTEIATNGFRVGSSYAPLAANITAVHLPDTITTIGVRAFYECAALSSINIPESVTELADYTFHSCAALTEITLPTKLTSIGTYCFYKTGLTTINLPSTLTTIGGSAFSYCTALDNITLPASLTTLGTYTFSMCSSLSSIEIPSTLTSLPNYMFQACTSLTSVTIPSTVTSVGNFLFYNCTGLTSVDYQATTAGTNTFNGCTSLTNVTLSDGLTAITTAMFRYCTGLRSFTIGENVTSIGTNAFNGCTGLLEVYNLSTSITLTIGADSNGYAAYYALAVYTSADASGINYITVGDYEFYLYDGEYYLGFYTGTGGDITLPALTVDGETVNYIVRPYAFDGNTAITSVSFAENSAKEIGDYAFNKCTNILNITLSDSVKVIDQYAFYMCSGCTTLNLGNGLTTIGEHAFHNMQDLTTVSIPGTVTSIGTNTFYLCKALESITIPSQITELPNNMFMSCEKLSSVTFEGEVTSFGESCFYGCGFTEFEIPSTITSLGAKVLYGNKSLTSVTIPDTITTLPNYMLAGCTALTSFTFPDHVTSIGTYFFQNCTGLQTVTLNDTISTIGTYTFGGCSALTSVVIGSGITTVATRAFNNCSALTSVYYKGTAEAKASSVGIVSTGNTTFTGATWYYYNESAATETTAGNYWYYDGDGNIVTVVVADSGE